MPKTLLLADDSVTIQKVVGISFASEDVELITVDNGNAAVERVRALRPDLVMADVVMPGKSGYEVCEAIQADPSLRHIPVLLLTGTFEAFDEERARRCGAAGHVSKPFEAQALVQRVKQLLSQSAAAAPAAPAPARAPLARAVPKATPPEPDAFEFFEDEIAELSSPELAPARPDASLSEDFSFGDDDLAAEPLAPAPAAAPARAKRPGSDATVALFAEPSPEPEFAGDPFEDDAGSTGPMDEPLPTLAAELLDEGDGGFEPAAEPDPDSEFRDDDEAPDLFAAEPLRDERWEPPRAPAAPASRSSREAPSTQIFGIGEPARAPAVFPARREAGTAALLGSEAPRSFDVSESDLEDSLSLEAPATARARRGPGGPEDAADERPARAAGPRGVETGAALGAPLSSELRAQLHDTLERAAWEAFGQISEELVKQAVERFEAIAWEVVPQMAEKMIRDTLERVTGESDDSER